MERDVRASAAITVALVDDEERVLLATSNLVRSLGYECLLFGSAEEAAAHPLSGVACVCSDVQMPGVSGLELARLLSRLRPSLPMILMTGYWAREVVEEARAIGVVELLPKPIDADRLGKILEHICRGPGHGIRTGGCD